MTTAVHPAASGSGKPGERVRGIEESGAVVVGVVGIINAHSYPQAHI
jgi:hypothetical protein